MGLRCTVFGHSWGDVEVHRDRQEDGDEMVVTVREARVCERCGAEDVLGESMEVTAIDPEDAGRATPEGGPGSGGQPTADAGETRPRDADTRGVDAGTEAEHDEEEYEAETDDGVILEEGGDATAERTAGEWPERPEHELEDPGDGEPSPWPESAREREEEPTEERFVGADHATPDDGGEVVDESDGEPAADGPDAGQSPGEPDAETGASPGHGTGESDPDGTTLEPGDDGIIEAGSTPGDEAVDDEPPAGAEPTDDESLAGAESVDDEPPAGAESADDEQSEDETVEIPRAETDPDEANESDGGATAHDSTAPAGDADAGTSDDATPRADEDGVATGDRPDDDAEVLEATEPNEQTRVTAEEPVDPAEHADDRGAEVGGRGAGGTDRSTGGRGDDRAGGSGRESTGSTGGTSGGGPGRTSSEGRGGTSGGDGDAGSPSLDPSEPPSDAEPAPEDVEYYCPECGYVDDSKWPSRRAGDVCPDCRRSYLAERQS